MYPYISCNKRIENKLKSEVDKARRTLEMIERLRRPSEKRRLHPVSGRQYMHLTFFGRHLKSFFYNFLSLHSHHGAAGVHTDIARSVLKSIRPREA